MICVSQSAPFLRSVAIPIGFYNGFLINADGALQGPSLYRPRRGFQGVQRVKKQRLSQCSMSVTHLSSNQVDFHPEHLWETFTAPIDADFVSKKHSHSPCIYRLAAAVLMSIRNNNFPILIETTINISKGALLFCIFLTMHGCRNASGWWIRKPLQNWRKTTRKMQKTVLPDQWNGEPPQPCHHAIVFHQHDVVIPL